MNGVDDPTVPAAFLAVPPPIAASPLVVSVPHAGRYYPPGIEAARAVPMAVLHELEDRHADRLIAGAVEQGAVGIVATHARAWIDLNRHEHDRADAPTSPHGRAGLGLMPLRLGGRALWHRPPHDGAVAERIHACHRPYHAAVAEALETARRRHGFALLVDCHSMPPLGTIGGRRPRIVIGDRHGASACPAIAVAVEAAARARGIAAARNAPYAGAYSLDRHGRPGRDIHAIQIEVDRSLYLGATLREPSPALAEIAELFAALCATALAAAAPPALILAAE